MAPDQAAGRKASAGARRWWLVLGLAGFVLVAMGVILRRTYWIDQDRMIKNMRRTREQLLSEQHRLEDSIRTASSRGRLMPIAQARLGMRVPLPEQVNYLTRRPLHPGRDSSPR